MACEYFVFFHQQKTSQMQVGVQIKTKSNGTIDRYKVHLVAKGYS
jgi:hypothetical protein